MIPESFIEELKMRCDIQSTVSRYVNLKRSGKNYVGICPFHSEKTPSFFVYPDTQSFYCFGCGVGGDGINFIKKIENLDYIEAVRYVAQQEGLTVPEDEEGNSKAEIKRTVYKINRETAKFFHSCLMSDIGKLARSYLVKRGLTLSTVKKFGLGYSPNDWSMLVNYLKSKGFSFEDMVTANVAGISKNGSYYDRFRNRVMFPIIDLKKNVIGFGGRALEDVKGAKYLNTSDTPVFSKSRNLFALNFAKSTHKDKILIAEGYMDVIALHQAGITNSVATLGTALTGEQARLLSTYTSNVVVSYDSDEAGQKATHRATKIFSDIGMKISILSMEGAKDPDEYIKKFGAQRFEILMDGCKNVIQFKINKLKEKYNLDVTDDKVSFLKDFCKLMATVTNKIERDVYIGSVCQELDVDKVTIKDQIKSILASKKRYEKKRQKNDIRLYVGNLPNNEKNVERKNNIKYALAEEELIRCILVNPDYFSFIDKKICSEDFVTSENKEIFSVIMSRIREGKSIEISLLGTCLQENKLGIVTGLLACAKSKNYDKNQTDKYINIILEHKNEKSKADVANMDDEELKKYISGITAKKFGGV